MIHRRAGVLPFVAAGLCAIGAIQAAKSKGVAGKLKIVGFDSSPTMIEDMQAGNLDSLVVQNPFRMGYAAVKALVEHAGGTLQNVVKITTYVTDVRRRMDFRVVRDEFFGPRGPASTMVEVSSLSHPDYLIEVEAVAIL